MSSAESFSDFGTAAAVGSNLGLIGAPLHDQSGNADRGAAFLFQGINFLNGTVTQNARLIASDGSAGDLFGASVSVDGTNGVLIGAPGDSTGSGNTNHGSAYLFREPALASGTVTQGLKLMATSSASGDNFGSSVALQNNVAIIGNPLVNFFGTNDRGAVYLFKDLSSATGTINESSILYDTTGEASDRIGSSVALWNDTAAAGSPGDDVGTNSNQGSACYFRGLAAAGSILTQAVKLTASDGAAGDSLGSAVALGGNLSSGIRYLVAGAPGDDTASTSDSGSAYLYRISTTATGTLTQSAKLTVVGPADGDLLGTSVSVSGTTAVVGAPALEKVGYACVYLNLNSITSTVTETLRIWPTAGTTDDKFGSAVAMDGDNLVIGARRGNGSTAFSGTSFNTQLSNLTTLDSPVTRTIEHLGFRSRTNWIIGNTADGASLTLAATASAEVPATGTSIRIGQGPTSDNNRLIVEGDISNTLLIQVGDSVNTGNEFRVNGIVTATNVNVALNSILSGGGTLAAATSINGSLRPGTGNVVASLRVAGNFTWNSGTPWQFDLAAGNSSDRLIIDGVGSGVDFNFVKGTGSTTRIFDFKGSSRQGTYTLVTWDGTTTFSPADFTATNVGGGLSATFAIVGKALTVTLGPSVTPLEQWRQTHFGSSANNGNGADTFDFDKDGIPNLVEYALGTLPTNANSTARPIAGKSSNRLTLQFTPQITQGLTYSIQTSPDLTNWTTSTLSGLTAGVPYTWTDAFTIPSNTKRFVRLRVTY
ncbi:MAG: FG-GAP repeat protein [Akkermansiaceae bacterium]|nr:FG-GAP repeat protein [Akkermansiaceae bacterium]